MLLAFTVAALALPAQDAATLRPIEAMDLFQLEGVANPTVSPDGSKVL